MILLFIYTFQCSFYNKVYKDLNFN
jgi:hypothetical protein